MIALDDARAHVLAGCAPLEVAEVALADAAGHVLVEQIVATEAVPPFANSAMDGFAVRAADTAGASEAAPVRLPVRGTILAGMAPTPAVGPGEAVRIMTGAAVPPGADAVVMVERTTTEGDVVAIAEEVRAGTAVRPAGDDLRPGDLVLPAGTVLGPAQLGVLAGIGTTSVRARRLPLVGVFSTGDELVEGDAPLGPGQIRDSNRVALLAAVRGVGLPAVDLGIVRDDEVTLTAAITAAVERCDALVTTGGVSMGDVDLVKVVLDRLGEMRWMQIAIKPAKPFAFGVLPVASRPDRTVPVFGLPGNPVSSLVSFELLARRALLAMAGYPPERRERPRVVAVVDGDLTRRPDGKTHFVRVVCRYDIDTATYRVVPQRGQGSHHLASLAASDGLAVLPDGDGVAEGERVEVILLDRS